MEKTLEEVYKQRTDVWLLAMAFANELGYSIGVRYDAEDRNREWPVLVIEDLPGGEIALHAKREDVHPVLLEAFETDKPYDGHTDQQKRERIWQQLDSCWKGIKK